ncbi:ran GTPase-activating protein 1 [Triticum aestivum]|uniref:ran GTPase-activating protein 1 n=1 Tax=Triticum aestivum TaxID=4565 RepID=UPI001D00578F|nr:ran GTPase-activating protein 1-like [Triticum aestivum]
MDLLEVFLRRCIQPLQYQDHPMWMYSGTEDTTRVHPEEVEDATLERWMTAITGNKDNPRGARRIPPLYQSYEPDKVTTDMYSMPNGAQEQIKEEGSGGESQEEWQSDSEEDEEDDSSGEEEEEEEEEEVDPPCTERRSKLTHDPAVERGEATVPIGQSTKHPRTTSPAPTEKVSKQPRATSSKPTKALPKMKMVIPTISGAATSETSVRNEDQEMEDVATSNLGMIYVVSLLVD